MNNLVIPMVIDDINSVKKKQKLIFKFLLRGKDWDQAEENNNRKHIKSLRGFSNGQQYLNARAARTSESAT